MLLEYDGTKFRHLDLEDMNYAEIAHVERVTGMSQGKLRSLSQQCLCDHKIQLHIPDVEGDPNVCKVPDCDCDDPIQDLSIEVAQALMWVSLKRARPEITFSQVGQIGVSDFQVVDEVEPDPTSGVDPQPPTPEAESETPSLPEPSEPSTSEPSPS